MTLFEVVHLILLAGLVLAGGLVAHRLAQLVGEAREGARAKRFEVHRRSLEGEHNTGLVKIRVTRVLKEARERRS